MKRAISAAASNGWLSRRTSAPKLAAADRGQERDLVAIDERHAVPIGDQRAVHRDTDARDRERFAQVRPERRDDAGQRACGHHPLGPAGQVLQPPQKHQRHRLLQARADLANIARELTRKYPGTNTGRSVNAQELLESSVGDYRTNLRLLLVAVGCVLLIACANVTNLQLARALGRGKELAVRAAMGASRWRLMRLMLIESLILGLIGGAAGLLIALWSLDAIHALSPPNVARFQQTHLDFLSLGFSAAIALVCGIVVGLWPAWRVSRMASLSGVLHEAGPRGGSESGDRQRARGVLVVVQVALALVLLAGAGLTLRSFWNSENAPLGFEPNGILTMQLTLPEARYDSGEKLVAFYRQILQRIEALPASPRPRSAKTFPSTTPNGIALSTSPARRRPNRARTLRPRPT